MCLTDSANSSSKRVIGRATAQSPQPACHPIPKAFAGTGNEVCPSSHSDLTCDQALNTAILSHSSLGIPQPAQALNFMRWLLPAQFQTLSPEVTVPSINIYPGATTAPTSFTISFMFSGLAQLLTPVVQQSLFSSQPVSNTSALPDSECNLEPSCKDSQASTIQPILAHLH